MSAYGADRDIPNTYLETPGGFTEEWATQRNLIAAGFSRTETPAQPGEQPPSEMLIEGEQLLPPDVLAQVAREARVKVLRNPAGEIVATWDEGPWWTPAESDEFVRQIVAELGGKPNRAERRRRRRNRGES